MAVTTAKIRAREKETGKNAYTGLDNAGNLHYAFDTPTLQSIIAKANAQLQDSSSAKAFEQALNLQNSNNQFNLASVQKQMDFQERMSSTSHQREVEDLIKAGLNPVLSANAGSSTPSGSSTTADTTRSQMALAQMQAGVQLEINKQNIESAQKMAKWSNDLERELGYASLLNSQAVAQIQAAASRYSADMSSNASRYAVNNPNNIDGAIWKAFFGEGNTTSAKATSFFDKLFPRFKKSESSVKTYKRDKNGNWVEKK